MDLYRENVLDHYRNPRNYGKMKAATASFKDVNLICGDEVEFFLKIRAGKITDVRHAGQGCAISQASASMISEKLKGMSIDELEGLDKAYVQKLVGTELTPSRLKCALLPLKVAQAAGLKIKKQKKK